MHFQVLEPWVRFSIGDSSDLRGTTGAQMSLTSHHFLLSPTWPWYLSSGLQAPVSRQLVEILLLLLLLRFSLTSGPGAADRFTGLETQFYQFTQGVMEPWGADSHQPGLQAWDSGLAAGPFSAGGR